MRISKFAKFTYLKKFFWGASFGGLNNFFNTESYTVEQN